jgi:putative exosortase-associated protein (TIGR04073 family)
MNSRPFVTGILFLVIFALFSSPLYAQYEYVDTSRAQKNVAAPEPFLESASNKLLRGVTNIVTSPAEIPKQIVVTSKDRGGPTGPVVGLFKGIGMTVLRIASGAWETVSFILPNDLDGNYDPILHPEYVWHPSHTVE